MQVLLYDSHTLLFDAPRQFSDVPLVHLDDDDCHLLSCPPRVGGKSKNGRTDRNSDSKCGRSQTSNSVRGVGCEEQEKTRAHSKRRTFFTFRTLYNSRTKFLVQVMYYNEVVQLTYYIKEFQITYYVVHYSL